MTAILHAHERKERQEQDPAVVQTKTAAENAPTGGQTASDSESSDDLVENKPGGSVKDASDQQPSVAQTPPLEEVWPVERIAQTPESSPTYLERSASDERDGASAEHRSEPQHAPSPLGEHEGQIGDAEVDISVDVESILQKVEPAKHTDSAVHVISPRRPRPVQMRPDPGSTQNRTRAAEPKETHPTPTVATEVGDLPVDLWGLIDEPTPLSPNDLSSQGSIRPLQPTVAHDTELGPEIGLATSVQRSPNDEWTNSQLQNAEGFHRVENQQIGAEDRGVAHSRLSENDTDVGLGAAIGDRQHDQPLTDVSSSSMTGVTTGQVLRSVEATNSPGSAVGPWSAFMLVPQGSDNAIQSDLSTTDPIRQRKPVDVATAVVMKMDVEEIGTHRIGTGGHQNR